MFKFVSFSVCVVSNIRIEAVVTGLVGFWALGRAWFIVAIGSRYRSRLPWLTAGWLIVGVLDQKYVAKTCAWSLLLQHLSAPTILLRLSHNRYILIAVLSITPTSPSSPQLLLLRLSGRVKRKYMQGWGRSGHHLSFDELYKQAVLRFVPGHWKLINSCAMWAGRRLAMNQTTMQPFWSKKYICVYFRAQHYLVRIARNWTTMLRIISTTTICHRIQLSLADAAKKQRYTCGSQRMNSELWI